MGKKDLNIKIVTIGDTSSTSSSAKEARCEITYDRKLKYYVKSMYMYYVNSDKTNSMGPQKAVHFNREIVVTVNIYIV